MTRPEQVETQKPQERGKKPSRFNPIGRWFYDRRARQIAQIQALEAAQKREADSDNSLKNDFAEIRDIVSGTLDLGNLGIAQSDRDSVSTRVTVNDQTTYTVSHSYSSWNGLPRTKELGKGGFIYLDEGLDRLTEVARQVTALKEAAVQVVGLIDGIDQKKGELVLKNEYTNEHFVPAAFALKVEDQPVRVAFGLINKKQNRSQEDQEFVRIIQTNKTAYVITEAPIPGSRNNYGPKVRKLRKFIAEAFDPNNQPQESADLATEDIEYLAKVTSAIPNSVPTHWREDNPYSLDRQYGKGRTREEVYNFFNTERVRAEKVRRDAAIAEQQRLEKEGERLAEQRRKTEEFERNHLRIGEHVVRRPSREDLDKHVQQLGQTLAQRTGNPTVDRENPTWQEIGELWNQDAQAILDNLESNRAVVLEGPYGNGKSNILVPKVIRGLNRSGQGVVCEDFRLMFGNPGVRNLFYGLEAAQLSKSGRAVVVLDEFTPYPARDGLFMDSEAVRRAYMEDMVSLIRLYQDRPVIPFFITVGLTREDRVGNVQTIEQIYQGGLPIVHYELGQKYIPADLAIRHLRTFGLAGELVDFFVAEGNECLLTPGMLSGGQDRGFRFGVDAWKRSIYNLADLKEALTATSDRGDGPMHWKNIVKYHDGGSMVALARMLINLKVIEEDPELLAVKSKAEATDLQKKSNQHYTDLPHNLRAQRDYLLDHYFD